MSRFCSNPLCVLHALDVADDRHHVLLAERPGVLLLRGAPIEGIVPEDMVRTVLVLRHELHRNTGRETPTRIWMCEYCASAIRTVYGEAPEALRGWAAIATMVERLALRKVESVARDLEDRYKQALGSLSGLAQRLKRTIAPQVDLSAAEPGTKKRQ